MSLMMRSVFALIVFILIADTSAEAQRRRTRRSGVSAQTVANQSSNETNTTAAARSLPRIASRAEFDRLARVYTDTAYALPHVLFVIDRRNNNRVYYVDSNRYRFHRDFVNGTYLSLERGREFFDNNYLRPNRRFILGTLAYQTPVRRWTFEFWEGDLIGSEQIALVYEIINNTFFEPVAYKPNSIRQDEASARLPNFERVLQSDIAREQVYEPLNLARGLGRIHIIDRLDDTVEIGENEIIVLNEVPIHLPPVAGIITSQPSTPLSHINLLARGWGIPNAYVRNAHELLRQYDGWWVSFETLRDRYNIRRADLDQLREYQSRVRERRDVMRPRSDLSVRRLASLREQRARDSIAYGGKSANLGEVMRARLPGIIVPGGFTIPFFHYDQFIRENNFEGAIFEMLNDQRFVHDPAYRRERLTQMRARLQAGTVNAALRAEVLRRVRAEFGERGVFLRSSSNTEDLPNFSGAGLHSSVPNARTDEQIVEAIKTVWASLWNFEAYETRERSSVDHSKVYMAVLVQEGINADSAGVMITTDPFDRDNREAIYISAKRGLGIRVVEGQRIAEQVIFRPRTQAVQVLTRSAEESLLTFDNAGGVREVAITGERNVLTDAMVRRLARTATQIKRIFGGREQDIEWVIKNNQIYIVQSRPFISGK